MEARGARWAKARSCQVVQGIPTGLGWRQVRQPKSLPAPSRMECTHICLKSQWDCILKLLPSYLPTPVSWIPCHWLLSTLGDSFTNLLLALCPSLLLTECHKWFFAEVSLRMLCPTSGPHFLPLSPAGSLLRWQASYPDFPMTEGFSWQGPVSVKTRKVPGNPWLPHMPYYRGEKIQKI